MRTKEQKIKRRIHDRQYYLENRERIIKKNREWCLKNKEHVRIKNKEWFLKNKEHCKEYWKKYNLKNKERISAYVKEYYFKNKEHFKEYKKEYYLKNKERIKGASRKYRFKNKERIKERRLKNRERHKASEKEWRLKNKEHFNETQRNRLRKDPNFKLAKNLRIRILKALKGKYKSASTMKLIGCTIDELWTHLESSPKWEFWMTRANHGLWHIDHIKACARFDLTDPAQQRECFHYTNLQPLEAIANIKKGAKIISGDITSPKM